MDDQLKDYLDNTLGMKDAPQTKIKQGEIWDIFRFTKEVAKLAAEHLESTAIMFAAQVVDDEDPDGHGHVACVIGGATPSHRCFGDMLMAMGGKLFQANFALEPASKEIVTREYEEDENA